MPDGISFKITGGAELARALEEKPPIVARQIIRTSLRRAVVPWQQEMIARVRKGWHVFGSFLAAAGLRGQRPKGPGAQGREREFGVIAKNIRIVTKLDGDFAGRAAVTPGKAFWAKFLEFGTKHEHRFPFIRPAFEEKKQAVLEAFIEDVRSQLNGLGMR